MHSAVHKTNSRKLLVLGILVAAAAIAYLFVDVSFSNERLFRYAMKIRIPKLMVMLVASAAMEGNDRISDYYSQYDCDTMSVGNEFVVYADSHSSGILCRFRKFSRCQCERVFCGRSVFNEYNSCLVYSYLFKKQTIMCCMYC